MFESFFRNIEIKTLTENSEIRNYIYPIDFNNLDGLKILYVNCLKFGSDNKNTEVATVSPKLFLTEIIEKHWNKISYVALQPGFTLTSLKDDKLVIKQFICKNKDFQSQEDLDEFFNSKLYHKLVVHSIVKLVDLENLTTTYSMRYCDISDKEEVRDNKLNGILN